MAVPEKPDSSPRLDPANELPDAPHPRPFPKPMPDPPALIAGKDLEHYWNETKWAALVTVVAQAVAFLANQSALIEWTLVGAMAIYLSWRIRRMAVDRQYLLAMTGIAGVFTGLGTAVVHLVLGRQLFYLAEFLRLPFETAIVTMIVGTGPVILYEFWRDRRARRTIKEPSHG